jgi:hypothetical protein
MIVLISFMLQYMGGSSLQSLAMFLDLHFRKSGIQPISPLFRHGMQHAEEFHLSLYLNLPHLPEPSVVSECVDAFFTFIWPLFPVLDQMTFASEIKRLQRLQYSRIGAFQEIVAREDVPILITCFIVIAIGADEQAGAITELGTTFLTAAYSLYAHLVSMPHLWSVQALFLLCVALRGRGKDGQAWHVLGQAIRISHSIGLHRRGTGQMPKDTWNRSHPNLELDRKVRSRVWWSCYAMEKMMQLETGRPPAIFDRDSDLSSPELSQAPYSGEGETDYLAIWVALAKILGKISEHIYGKPDSAHSLLHEMGRLDIALEEWAKSIPEGLKPGPDILAAGDIASTALHSRIASFLAVQYYQV